MIPTEFILAYLEKKWKIIFSHKQLTYINATIPYGQCWDRQTGKTTVLLAKTFLHLMREKEKNILFMSFSLDAVKHSADRLIKVLPTEIDFDVTKLSIINPLNGSAIWFSNPLCGEEELRGRPIPDIIILDEYSHFKYCKTPLNFKTDRIFGLTTEVI